MGIAQTIPTFMALGLAGSQYKLAMKKKKKALKETPMKELMLF